MDRRWLIRIGAIVALLVGMLVISVAFASHSRSFEVSFQSTNITRFEAQKSGADGGSFRVEARIRFAGETDKGPFEGRGVWRFEFRKCISPLCGGDSLLAKGQLRYELTGGSKQDFAVRGIGRICGELTPVFEGEKITAFEGKGPMYPAAWETSPLPKGSDNDHGSSYRPLVYGICSTPTSGK